MLPPLVRAQLFPARVSLLTKIIALGHVLDSRIADMMGVPRQNVNLGDLPTDSCKVVINTVTHLYQRFPCLKGWTQKLSFDRNCTEGIAYSVGREIVLCNAFSNYEELAKKTQKSVLNGHFPTGTNVSGIVAHEFGHQINNLLTHNKAHGANQGRKGSTTMCKIVLHLIGWNGGSDDEQRKFIAANISKYATKNHSEMFAELFSEYITSPQPRPAAICFGKLLKESLKQI